MVPFTGECKAVSGGHALSLATLILAQVAVCSCWSCKAVSGGRALSLATLILKQVAVCSCWSCKAVSGGCALSLATLILTQVAVCCCWSQTLRLLLMLLDLAASPATLLQM